MVKITQNTFLAGMLDWEMMGRQDFDRYRNGASFLRNFSFLQRGAISKRPGTNYVKDLTELIGSGPYRMLPFSYAVDRGWVLVLKDRGGFCVSADGTVVHVSVAPSSEGAETPAGLPYRSEDLDQISYVQCGDVLFLAHPAHPPAKIEHRAAGEFVFLYLDMNGYMRGVPRITGLSLDRLPVDPNHEGGEMIERYRASAVRDGVETVPSSIASLSYSLPWTESQSISVSMSWDGQPDRIKIYKAGDGTFGLIGVIENGEYTATGRLDSVTGLEPINVVSGQTPTERLDKIERHSAGQSGWFSSAGEVVVELATAGQEVSQVSVALGYTLLHADSSGNVTATHIPTMPGAACRLTVYTRSGSTWTSRGSKTSSLAVNETARVFSATSEGSREKAMAAAKRWSDAVEGFDFITVTFSKKKIDAIKIVAQVKTSGSSSYQTATGSVIAAEDGSVQVFGNPLVVGNITASGEGNMRKSFKDNNIMPDSSVTPLVRKDVFSKAGDYPSTVAIYQQRLVWAGSNNDPARIWMSRIGDLYSYAPHDVITPSDPIDFVLPITRFARINFIIELRKLLVFSDACEWVVSSSSATQGVSYETIMATPHSFLGCDKRLPPIVCNNSLIFCERTGQDVRRYGYQLEDDGYGGTNISILARSIFTQRRIKDWAYQQHPDSTIWSVMSDGEMASLAWMEEQDIIAWGTHKIGGPDARVTGIANTYALVGTGENPTTDEVFLMVERGTGAERRIVLESMRVWCRERDAIRNAVSMDSVRDLKPGDTPRAGATLIDPVSGREIEEVGPHGAIEGFTFAAELVSVYPVLGNEVGDAQFDLKVAQHAHVRSMYSVGGSVRAFGVPERMASPLGGAPEFDGKGNVSFERRDDTVPLVCNNDGDGRIVIRQDNPWPFTLLLLETDFEVEEPYRR